MQPPVPTSEIALARAASSLEQTVGDRSRFDIRWLGAIHAVIFLAFYAAVLRLLRPLSGMARFALSLLALWIFADIGTLAYFNSFYSDVAAILGGLAAAFLAANLLAAERLSSRTVVLFGLAALLFVTSKAQHGVFGFVPAGFALLLGWRSTEKRTRATALAVGTVLLAATIWIVSGTPGWYRAEARFNLVFYKILPDSRSPAQDLAELGLGAGDARYIGLHSFVRGGPMESSAWVDGFRARCTYGKVLVFYLRHPARAWAILRAGLEQEAWQRRVPGLANFARSSGHPEGATATSLGSWSALRTWASRVWPWQIVIWLGMLPLAALWFALHGAARFLRALAWTILSIAVLAWGEFAMACLADTLETPRHLTMFQVFTDLVIFMGLVFAVRVLESACPVSLRKPAFLAAAAALAVFAACIVNFEVFPAAVPVEAHGDPSGRDGAVDDASPAVSYSGKWSKAAFRSAFGGTLSFSDEPGAVARFSFDGTELQYLYTKAPNRGMAKLTIDGTVRDTIDLYSPQIVWQVRTVAGGLAPGHHLAEISVAGQHNPASSGNFIDIDALLGR